MFLLLLNMNKLFKNLKMHHHKAQNGKEITIIIKTPRENLAVVLLVLWDAAELRDAVFTVFYCSSVCTYTSNSCVTEEMRKHLFHLCYWEFSCGPERERSSFIRSEETNESYLEQFFISMFVVQVICPERVYMYTEVYKFVCFSGEQ